MDNVSASFNDIHICQIIFRFCPFCTCSCNYDVLEVMASADQLLKCILTAGRTGALLGAMLRCADIKVDWCNLH